MKYHYENFKKLSEYDTDPNLPSSMKVQMEKLGKYLNQALNMFNRGVLLDTGDCGIHKWRY